MAEVGMLYVLYSFFMFNLIAQGAVRWAVLDALTGWVLDVVVSIAVMCPTVSCYVLNMKEQTAASQFNFVDR